MIKDAKLLAEFNDELLKKERLDYAAALRILEAMWEEGRKLGVLPLKDVRKTTFFKRSKIF